MYNKLYIFMEVKYILNLICDYKEYKVDANYVSFASMFLSFIKNLKSSYQKHNYWVKFYQLVLNKKPDLIVEMGILEGYSLFSFARGCVENRKGKIVAIDLFEDYPYHHSRYDDIKSKLEKWGMDKCVYLHKGDAFNLDLKFDDKSIDLLHIDLSNTGDKIEKLLLNYYHKMKDDGIILFEGGSKSRDNIPWMNDYKCVPIAPILEKEELTKLYDFFVIENYPSLTICYKKNEQSKIIL